MRYAGEIVTGGCRGLFQSRSPFAVVAELRDLLMCRRSSRSYKAQPEVREAAPASPGNVEVETGHQAMLTAQ
jgi:hypothetical protein